LTRWPPHDSTRRDASVPGSGASPAHDGYGQHGRSRLASVRRSESLSPTDSPSGRVDHLAMSETKVRQRRITCRSCGSDGVSPWMSRDECTSRSSDCSTASCLSTDVAEPLLARRALAAVGALGARLLSRAAGSRRDSSEASSALPSLRARMPSDTASAHRLSTPDSRGSGEQPGPRSATTSVLTYTSLQAAQTRAGGIQLVGAVLRTNSLCRGAGAPEGSPSCLDVWALILIAVDT
jgi:hypothetical protein